MLVGSQVEGLITRAHGVGQSLGRSLMATAAAEGWISLLVPHGMLMVAAREVPYAGCLFFLSAKIRAALEPPEGAAAPLAMRVPRDLLAACVRVRRRAALAGAVHDRRVPAGARAGHRRRVRRDLPHRHRLLRRADGAHRPARRLALRLPVHDGGAQPVAERLFPQR